MCLLLTILIFTGLIGVLVELAIHTVADEDKLWSSIFLMFVIVIFLMILIRFIHLLVKSYFIGINYNIEGYEGYEGGKEGNSENSYL